MVALLLGSVLAVLGLAYVMLPLLRGSTLREAGPLAPDLPPEASAIDALREIEFDQATGKLSPEDYATLKATYTPKALAELKARETSEQAEAVAAGTATAEDPAEAMIARAKSRKRACPEHGARPESDAMFCSDCGRYLGAACLGCGAQITSDTARFCTDCGAPLGA
jgi:hypothetical protein